MRILVTNDDGIHALGLAALTQVATILAGDTGEVIVVAPAAEMSGKSSSITLAPLRCRRVAARTQMRWLDASRALDPVAYSIAGTPTDCVRISLANGGPLDPSDQPRPHSQHGDPDRRPDWWPDLVLSGINHGANLAHDTTYSGTVGAANEAAAAGIPAAALSWHQRDKLFAGTGLFDAVTGFVARLLQLLRDTTDYLHARGSDHRAGLVNINLPGRPPTEFAGVRRTVLAAYHLDEQFDGSPGTDETGPYVEYQGGRVGQARRIPNLGWPTDLEAIDAGYVSVTPLFVDRTLHSRLGDADQAADAASDSAAEREWERRLEMGGSRDG